MRYESAKSPKGNVGVSYTSQEAADQQAAQMDENDCANCTNCTNCTDCTGCKDCTDCTDCAYCTDCTDCMGCTCCRYCTYCTDCTDCTGCTNCVGVLGWNGGPATNLLSINGLRWHVATDGERIQIGCQNHSVEEWESSNDSAIFKMHDGALDFWRNFKSTVLAMAAYRKGI